MTTSTVQSTQSLGGSNTQQLCWNQQRSPSAAFGSAADLAAAQYGYIPATAVQQAPLQYQFQPLVPPTYQGAAPIPAASAYQAAAPPVQAAPPGPIDTSWMQALASVFRGTLEGMGFQPNSQNQSPSTIAQDSDPSRSHKDGPAAKRQRRGGPELRFDHFDIAADSEEVSVRGDDDDELDDEAAPVKPSEREILMYREKIKLVRDLEGMETQETELASTGGLGVDPIEKKVKLTLPASPGFFDYFDQYNKSLSGRKIVKGVQKPPTEIGSFPKLYEPQPTYYAIDDCPWQSTCLGLGTNLLDKQEHLYVWGEAPQIRMTEANLKKLETNERRCLNVASYTDHFVYGCKLQLKSVQDKLMAVENDQPLPFQEVMNIFKLNDQMFGLLDSIARGNQTQAFCLADRVSQFVTMRRDAWLKGMDSSLPLSEKYRLRALSANTPTLFPKDEVEKAKKAVKTGKEEKLHENLLKAQAQQNASTDKNNNSSKHNFYMCLFYV